MVGTDPIGEVRSERHGDHVVVLTIDRPERRNAFDLTLAASMEAAVDAFEADDQLWVAVLTGAGGDFCAGQDLRAAARGELGATFRRGGAGIMGRPPAKPVIAAVEGVAVGGGLELALACDLIVAARDARLGLPEVTHGVVAVGGGLFRLPRWLPHHLAVELALTGVMRTAQELAPHGLINRLTDPGGALDSALDLAEAITHCGPLAVAASAQVLRRAHDWTDAQAWSEQHVFTDPAMTSRDAAEGIAAFTEKRRPVWEAR